MQWLTAPSEGQAREFRLDASVASGSVSDKSVCFDAHERSRYRGAMRENQGCWACAMAAVRHDCRHVAFGDVNVEMAPGYAPPVGWLAAFSRRYGATLLRI